MNQELCQTSVENLSEESLKDWLKQQAQNYQLPYLLAHAEDGVIWGHFDIDSGTLTTAREIFIECNFPKLCLNTLQQCRVFGEAGEVLLWNSNGEWRSRPVLQSKVSELIAQDKIGLIPETQILWGTQGKTNGNFTLLSDGSQGLKHAVPIPVEESYFRKDKNELYRPVRLEVNHYFCYNSDGVARIFLSRLVSLKKEKI
ncbi:type III-D CRISPR-associated protein Csx19 [Limnofasciculus baicalensis]|uniref:CRISPR-associated protein Csx19 n=1 Tax=Limnofasciculus baicalensis BBK-W-15 TaxID=2699891 RepID=A0AAE3GNT5_9CYAN|nr:CRISPR-associated protein Csx19 [Limnofasciculus baicalensis]MCP2727178.1 CRISPR-associated protein Csx19 [Limnofasciculus baicalensis BBK-W-15]